MQRAIQRRTDSRLILRTAGGSRHASAFDWFPCGVLTIHSRRLVNLGRLISYVRGDGTADVCAIDLSEAFDKFNHDALFLKLMKRRIPNELLNILDMFGSLLVTYV